MRMKKYCFKTTVTAILLCITLVCNIALATEEAKAALYSEGMDLISEGDYSTAFEVFLRLYGYADSDEKVYALLISAFAEMKMLSSTSAMYEYKGLYGMVDFVSNTIIPPKWTTVKEIDDSHFAIEENSLWGIVGIDGRMIFEPQWEQISMANDDICTVYKNGEFGLININGEVLQRCSWKAIGDSCINKGNCSISIPYG